ncbi:Uronate dehydrogenase [subsurface metagenome]
MSTRRIAVMGGSGTIGEYVIDELRKHNYEIAVFVHFKEPKRKDVTLVRGDVLKIDDCKKALKGIDAVIHLAAIPHLFNDPPEKVFHVNVIGTFNVLQAASDLGIEKVVYASSDSSYGFNWRNSFDDLLLPAYLPIDENHPQKPKDAYGLSKKVGEEIARAFTRKYGMSTISLRISHTRVPEESHEVGVAAYRKDINEKGRMLPPRVYNEEGNITQIFCYNDVRDVAQAFRLAVEAKGLEGKSEAFNICADDNPSKFDSREFIKMVGWSEVPLKKEIKGRQSLFDWSKAKRLLGYQPLHSWYRHGSISVETV